MIAPQRHEAHKDRAGMFSISVFFVPLWCIRDLVGVLGNSSFTIETCHMLFAALREFAKR